MHAALRDKRHERPGNDGENGFGIHIHIIRS
jgi:hypothetical protein